MKNDLDRVTRQRGCTHFLRAAVVGCIAAGSAAYLSAAPAFPVRTQTFDLKQGWNAVHLEVEPLDTAPSRLFAGTPVDVAAQYTRAVRRGQFATDPGKILANDDSWSVWYGPEREESFLSGLHAMHSHNAFLVHSRENFVWRVTGQVYLKRIVWKADSYNLVGFPVDSAAAPTFGEYFRGIAAHTGKPVYRLTEGRWRRVENPDTTLMRRGEAYWVYSEGGSHYQGPSEVRLRFGDHLRYGPGRFNGSFSVINRSPNPVKVTLLRESGMPLDFVFRGVLEQEVQNFTAPLPAAYAMPAMEAGTEGAVTLRVRDSADIVGGSAGLLRVRSDAGTEYWVAVYAETEG